MNETGYATGSTTPCRSGNFPSNNSLQSNSSETINTVDAQEQYSQPVTLYAVQPISESLSQSPCEIH